MTVQFDGDGVHLLLATDGIFESGRGPQRARVLALARNFVREGDGVLDGPGFDDDRTLVVVRRAAA